MPIEIYSVLSETLPPSVSVLVVLRGDESGFRLLHREDLDRLDDGVQQSLRITDYVPTIDVKSESSFMRANANVLVIDVGAKKNSELGETVIGGTFDGNGAWVKPIVSALKRKMKAGAKVKSKTTGAVGFMKGHWLSPGAIQFAEDGGALRAFAGASEYLP